MPNTKSAKKYVRRTKKATAQNNERKTTFRKFIKKAENLIKENKPKEAQKLLPKIQKAIDKATKNGILKKNTAARKKSGLVKKIKALKK